MSTDDMGWEELVNQLDRKVSSQNQVIDELNKLINELYEKHHCVLEKLYRKVRELEGVICELLEDEGE